MDWLARGLPWDGDDRATPCLMDVMKPLPSCAPSDTAAQARERMGGAEACVVLDTDGVVLGLLRRERLQEESQRRADARMDAAPTTWRPHHELQKVLDALDKAEAPLVLVTDPDGHLLGAAMAADVREHALASADHSKKNS